MLHPGTLLEGKYRILQEIGRGGMSTVYLALNERANKTWAVKEIRRDKGAVEDVQRAGLVAETEMLKKLHHPHLPDIVDVIEEGDSLLIVMEYIQGRDLQKILDERQRVDPEGGKDTALDPEAVRAWAIQLCEVLEYLHSRNPPIIYRDLKPANIMLQETRSDRYPYGSVCLIDFGTAREMKSRGTGDTVALGTRGYAAPEQFGGLGETDARTDIYNLGATMYHLLTGYSPAQTSFTFLPVGQLRPELQDSGLEMIVAKCCEPAREDRYQNAEELKYDLVNEGLLCGPVIRRYRIRWRLFLGAAALTAAAAFSSVLLGCARIRVRNMTYESCIQRAESAETVPEGHSAYLDAVCLSPGEPQAYEALIGAIERDSLFTAEERKVLEDCLNSRAQGHTLANADELRRASPGAYDRLMYRIGTDYFFYYENEDGYRYAAQKLGSVRRKTSLDQEKREDAVCASLELIAGYCVKQRQNSRDESWISGTDAADVWQELVSYTAIPGEAVSRCGTKRIAAAMYRELAGQIARNADSFRDAGVTEEEMQRALENTAAFVRLCFPESGSTDYDRKLLQETRQAVEAARFRLDSLYRRTGGLQFRPG